VLSGQSHARRADLRGDGEGHLLLQWQQLKLRILQYEPVAFRGHPLAVEQPADDADSLVLAIALHHRVDPERVSVGGERAGSGAKDRPSTSHPVELHHALRNVERVVIGQGDDAGSEFDTLRPLAGGGQEHLGRADHLPAARMVLAAPELVIAEPVEMLDEVEVAAELQQRMLADRMVRREKSTKIQARHDRFSCDGDDGKATLHPRRSSDPDPQSCQGP
jgi:hypothetical protein